MFCLRIKYRISCKTRSYIILDEKSWSTAQSAGSHLVRGTKAKKNVVTFVFTIRFCVHLLQYITFSPYAYRISYNII